MTHSSAPNNPAEERVLSFMAEYEAQWQIAAPAFADRDPENPMSAFQVWRELMEQTMRNHFTDSSMENLAQSFGQPASHGPAVEQLVRSEVDGDVAYVLTESTSMQDKLSEYTLRQHGAEWRISTIAQHFGDPTEPFVDPAVVKERMQQPSVNAPLAEVPDAEAHLDEVHNFTVRDVTHPDDGAIKRADITQFGTLVTSTGVLAVLDFGYDNDSARPLERTVAPGSYPVERITAFNRNAAVRVRFSSEAPVAWHPATPPSTGHVVGVDAGCICIVDYAGYSAMTRREKAGAFATFVAAPNPSVHEFATSAGDRGVAFDSGYGDGSYPAYWGVDAQGRMAQLVVDCMVLVVQGEDGMLTHL